MLEKPNEPRSPLLSFESFALDTQKHALFSASERIHLTGKPLHVLEYLVAHAGETVSKRDLLDAVWTGLFVTDDVLVQAVGEIRRALGDDKGDPRFVQTIPREGYRFVARVCPQSPPIEGQNQPGQRLASAPEIGQHTVFSTPDGMAPARHDGTEANPGARAAWWNRRWLAGLAAALLLGTVVAGVWWRRAAPGEAAWRQPLMIPRVAGRPRMPSYSPDASMIAFVNEVNGVDQIFVTHVGQGSAVQLTFGDVPSRRPRWSPRNDEILYSEGDIGASPAFGVESIWSVPPLGGVPHVVVQNARNPNWSRDGSLIVFERRDEVWIAGREGKNGRRVSGIPRTGMLLANRTPAFSPDGTQIVFFQPESGPQGDLWIVPVKGGEARRLTFDVCDGGSPVWTPDAQSIIFVSQRSGVADLWTISSSGGKPRLAFGSTGENSDPDISADGRRLVFSNTRNQFALTVLDPVTGQVRELLERRLAISYPMFSPAADKLSFFSVEGEPGIYQVFTIDLDGTHLNQVTRDSSERNKFPHWSPDGRFLYYYRNLPDRSYRKTPVAGESSTQVVPGWTWEMHYGARIDPTDEWLVYTATRGGTPFRTLVRNLKTTAEHSLERALDDPRWSADGRFVLGTDLRGQTPPEGDISICPRDGRPCGTLSRGYMPVPSRDNRSVYFLRAGQSAEHAELWVTPLLAGSDRKVADLRPLRSIAHFYDVSPRGEIAYVQLKPGARDLWVSELR